MDYEVIIGLEVHSELLTKTKIYCGCSTEFGGEPNTRCCPVCMGLPGALPVLNKKVVEYAVRAGLALNCSIDLNTHMARKNYFYPDCPKNYQITQDTTPICYEGYIEVETEEGKKKIGIQRIHIEEDAGKGLHREDGTYVDFNRAGVPLIEIVSKPDMRSPQEAKMYLEKLKGILHYTGVSDCKMEEGSLRCDANVSIRPVGQEAFGVKAEVKNMNSFKAVEKALEYEISRQKECLSKGEKLHQETRRWDEATETTIVMRSKEEANDYRYFPEPDMVYLKLDEKWVDEVKNSIPELPHEKRERYTKEYGIPAYDAEMLTMQKEMADYFEETVKLGGKPKDMSNWLMGEVVRSLKEKEKDITQVVFKPAHLVSLASMVDAGKISGTIAKKVFKEMFDSGDDPEKIVVAKGLLQVSDESEIRKLINTVLDSNLQSVEDYKNGKTKALGFVVGQVMKESKGKANPQMVNKLLIEEIVNR